MPRSLTRRSFLAALPPLCAASALTMSRGAVAQPAAADAASPFHAHFPAQDPDRVRQMVGASHGDAARVAELLAESPALAKAAWDWGFGDWETALGAASHTGQRDIARLLMGHGARPDLFTFAMLGDLAVVRACVEAQPGVQRITGPHGLTLLHHAQQGGPAARAVADYLLELGDADPRPDARALEAADLVYCAGRFVFAPGDAGVFLVTEKDGGLRIKRLPDGAARPLVHLGGRVFHPAGAPAVRIEFDGEGARAGGLRVADGPLRLAARREDA